MQKLIAAWIAVLTIGFATTASAADKNPVRDHDIEPEDYFTIGVMSGCAMSPDGTFIAYSETRWEPPKESRNTDLWIVETKSHQVRRLTFDPAGDRSPQWNADGTMIYFASNRKQDGQDKPPYDGKTQVWRISPNGGPPQAVTRVKDGITRFDLSQDGGTLYYSIAEKEVDEAWKELRSKYDELKYGHGVNKLSKVWKLNLENWRAKEIVDDNRVIVTMAVSPDQAHIAMVTRPDEKLVSNEGWSRVDVYDAATGEVSTVTPDGWRDSHPSPYGWIDNVAWSDDGAALAFTVSFDGYAPLLYAAEVSANGTPLFHLKRPDGVTVEGGRMEWRAGSRDLCFMGQERARQRVYCISDVRDGHQGAARSWTPGDVAVRDFDFSRSGDALTAIIGTVTHTPDLFLVTPSGQSDRITSINPQVDTWKLPKISIVNWNGAGGDSVEGILELPPGYQPGKPLPMVVELHGGPTSASLYRFRLWIYGRALLPAKGYAVFSPNYRGSTGYGDKFLADLVGRENDIEVEDILKGVDAMVVRGIADPERLGVMGWSNGGFLTNCLITKTTRFKAASSGAGVLAQIMQWGIEDTPGHVINYMQGFPWSAPESYAKGSPLFDLDKVTTPTLIHVGENDARVPTAHSRTLHRALRRYLHVPTELVIYPGEGHGLTKYTHRKAKMEWDLAWFDRYIMGVEPEPSAPSATN